MFTFVWSSSIMVRFKVFLWQVPFVNIEAGRSWAEESLILGVYSLQTPSRPSLPLHKIDAPQIGAS